jgi:hypothetical protein
MCAELGKQGCCARIRLSLRPFSSADARHMYCLGCMWEVRKRFRD